MPSITNPVLRGFNPDSSVVRVGEDYCIATSTFEWWPGVALHHSRDLVHWRLIGHALTRESQLNLRGIADSGGVWAPSLSHHDGQFWLIYTNVRTCGAGRPFKDVGIYLTTAPAIHGPWSDPVTLNATGFDPSLFHDEDGRKWLVNMMWDFRPGRNRFAGIVVQEYDPAIKKLIGPMTKILGKEVLTEGPNLYQRDGWYYLMLAEGGTGWNHGISMARSRAITGPYELDPQASVMTTRDAPDCPLQKAGHGELVQTPAGEWYLVHLASRPLVVGDQRRCTLGRETCLQQVIWSDDGWLRLAQGGTRPLVEVLAPMPATGGSAVGASLLATQGAPCREQARSHNFPPTITVPPERDECRAVGLGPEWSAPRGPIDENWASLTARPGWLRLRGRESLHSLYFQSLVAQRLTEHRATARTCLEFAPTHFTQSAGLVCYYDTRMHFYLRVTHDEARGRVLGIVFTDDGTYGELADFLIEVNDWSACHLQAEIDGARLQFSASRDGAAWQPVGPARLVETFRRLRRGPALHGRVRRIVRARPRWHRHRGGLRALRIRQHAG
jgi:xylan 1,4-beta-xylosidase